MAVPMFVLPEIVQDYASRDVPAEIRPANALSSSLAQVIDVRSERDFQAAIKELLELDDVPRPDSLDLNALHRVFGVHNALFIQSLGEFILLRERLPIVSKMEIGELLVELRHLVYETPVNTTYAQLLVDFVGSSLSLNALVLGLEAGVEPSPFFASTLPGRLLKSTRELRLYIDAAARGEKQLTRTEESRKRLKDWAEKAGQSPDGSYSPYAQL